MDGTYWCERLRRPWRNQQTRFAKYLCVIFGAAFCCGRKSARWRRRARNIANARFTPGGARRIAIVKYAQWVRPREEASSDYMRGNANTCAIRCTGLWDRLWISEDDRPFYTAFPRSRCSCSVCTISSSFLLVTFSDFLSNEFVTMRVFARHASEKRCGQRQRCVA